MDAVHKKGVHGLSTGRSLEFYSETRERERKMHTARIIIHDSAGIRVIMKHAHKTEESEK